MQNYNESLDLIKLQANLASYTLLPLWCFHDLST